MLIFLRFIGEVDKLLSCWIKFHSYFGFPFSNDMTKREEFSSKFHVILGKQISVKPYTYGKRLVHIIWYNCLHPIMFLKETFIEKSLKTIPNEQLNDV